MARRNSNRGNKNRGRRSSGPPASRRGMSDDYAVPMDAGFTSSLNDFMSAGQQALGGNFSIYSGSRSPNRQAELKRDIKGRPVGSKYGSRHVHGKAADLRYNGKAITKAPKAVREWMRKNAPAFGLAFTVPGEPWHIEPTFANAGAGVRAAVSGGILGQSLPGAMPAPSFRPDYTGTPYGEPATPMASAMRFGDSVPGSSYAGTEQSFDHPAGLNPSRMGGIGAIGNSMAGLETDRPVANPGGRFGVPGNSFAGLETARSPTPGMSMAGTERSPGGLNPSRFGGSPGGLLDRHQDRYDRMSAPPGGDGGLVTASQGGPSPSRFGDSVFGDDNVFDDSGYQAAQDFGRAFGTSQSSPGVATASAFGDAFGRAASPARSAATPTRSFSTGTMTDVVSPSASSPRTAAVSDLPSYAGQETAARSVPGTSYAGLDRAPSAPLDTSSYQQASAQTPAQQSLDSLGTNAYTEDLPTEVRTTGAPTASLEPVETVNRPSLQETPSAFPAAPPAPVQQRTLAPRPEAFPAAPQPPKEAMFAPSTKFGMRVGNAVAGPLGMVAGGLLGSGFGKMMRDLPSYRDQIAAEQFDVGSGLGGIMAAQGGQRGATGTSRSNPGMSVTSLGNGDTMRRSNTHGWTEIVGPDGSVKGIQYDNPKDKGLLGRISGGIFSSGGSTRGDRSLSREVSDAIDRGSVGLY